MATDYTELFVVLDRSGSMHQGRDDHEGGLRSFVEDQRRLAGDVRLTFVRFDDTDPFELVYDGVPLEEVREEKLSLIPRGNTPLLNAVGMTLEHIQSRMAGLTTKPDQIVVMVITDGQENASHHCGERHFTKEEVKKLVTDFEASGIGKILYLGANVDEFSEAGAIGVMAGASLGYAANTGGIKGMYASLGQNVMQSRCAVQGGVVPVMAMNFLNFTDDQRAKAMEHRKQFFDPHLTTTTGGTAPAESKTDSPTSNPDQ